MLEYGIRFEAEADLLALCCRSVLSRVSPGAGTPVERRASRQAAPIPFPPLDQRTDLT